MILNFYKTYIENLRTKITQKIKIKIKLLQNRTTIFNNIQNPLEFWPNNNNMNLNRTKTYELTHL